MLYYFCMRPSESHQFASNLHEPKASLGAAKAEALRRTMAEREATNAAVAVARNAAKTLKDMLPIYLADPLPEGDALQEFIRMTSESAAKYEPGVTSQQIAFKVRDWIEAHPAEHQALNLLIQESYLRRLERALGTVPTPQTDREVTTALDTVSQALLAERVPERWVQKQMNAKRRSWTADIRASEKNWDLLERSLPDQDVRTIRESVQGDGDALRSRVAELTEAAEHLSDRVRHAIGVVAMHAEKRRLYETLAELARRAEPVREANDRNDAARLDIDARNASIESTRNALERIRENQRVALEADRATRQAKRQALYKPMGEAISKRAGMKRRADAIPADKQAAFQAEFAATSALADEYTRQFDALNAPSASEYDTEEKRIADELAALYQDQALARQTLETGTAVATRLQNEAAAEIQEIAAALPPMSERNRGHRAFVERLTFLGVQPSQEDWEQFIRSYDAAMRGVLK